MADPSWQELQQAYASGSSTEHEPLAHFDRRVEFEDGTIWFPDGAGEAPGTTLGPAALFGLTIIVGFGSLVLFVDSHPWAFVSLVPTGLCVLALVLLVRRIRRAEKAAEARLERGLFLLADTLVIRDPPYDKRTPRAKVEGFVIRRAVRGHEKSFPWIHVVLRDGAGQVPLDVTEMSLQFFQRWLAGTQESAAAPAPE